MNKVEIRIANLSVFKVFLCVGYENYYLDPKPATYFLQHFRDETNGKLFNFWKQTLVKPMRTWQPLQQTVRQIIMSANQHRRNFSFIPAPKIDTANKIGLSNRSLGKIKSSNNYSFLLAAGKKEYYQNKNMQAAISNFEQYLSYFPHHEESLYLCSLAYIQADHHHQAISKLKNYLHLTIKRTSSHNNGFNRKLIISPQSMQVSSAQIYLLLAITYNKINQIYKALESVNFAIKSDSQFEQGYCFRAKIYLIMGQNQKAFHDYRQVLKFNAQSFAAWLGLADYYTHHNSYKQALSHYTKALNFTSQASNQVCKISPRYNQLQPGQNRIQLNKQPKPKQDSLLEFLKNRQSNYHQKPLQYSRRYRLNTEILGSETKSTFSKEKEIGQIKTKRGLKSITNPFNRNLFESKQERKSSYRKTMGEGQSDGVDWHPPTEYQQQRSSVEIKLKIAICLYFLGDYEKSIKTLKGLPTKRGQVNSQIYYYLAVSQQKLHQQFQSAKAKNVRHQRKRGRSKDVELSYDPSSLLQESIINFQLSIKSASNKKVMVKSCKSLIKVHIENSQFYETEAIIKLAEGYGLDIKWYKELSEACMLVIKQKYAQALPILDNLYKEITGTCTSRPVAPLQKQSKEKGNKSDSVFQTSSNCLGLQQNELNNKDLTLRNSNEQKKKHSHNTNEQTCCNIAQFPSQIPPPKTGPQNSGTAVSERNKQHRQPQMRCGQKDYKITSIPSRANMKQKSAGVNHGNKSTQLQWMKPIILLFKAYSEYFSNNFVECLALYEHYENYIKDYLGKQPQSCIYLSYNKVLCEGVLMLDNQMIEESLEKFHDSLEAYHRKLNAIPVEPILLRILAMFRMAISQSPYLNEELNSKQKILVSIIDILQHYLPVIKTCPLVHYYYGVALYELGNYKKASECLQKCLKIADECTWKFLFVKGVIEIKNFAFKEAAREFSAGLLVEERAEMFLGRSICYSLLSEEQIGERRMYVQKSYEDLQNFIELEEDKTEVSKWAAKILFFNQAFEEVLKHMGKISPETIQDDGDLSKIQRYLNIYGGEFEEGGVLGKVIINAFEGNFERNILMINSSKHEITLSDFVDQKYHKWLSILNLYSAERYLDLVKYLQIAIFEEKSEQDAAQLRYNLAVVYYLLGEMSKADNLLVGLPKYLEDIDARVQKLISRNLLEDECIDDLQEELKGVKRLSSFLPYRRVHLQKKGRFFISEQKCIFMKISIPFPPFFKPEIDLSLDTDFLNGETAQQCISKKIQAPWIKKVVGNIQFTDNIVDSSSNSILDQDQDDLLASKSESGTGSVNELHQF